MKENYFKRVIVSLCCICALALTLALTVKKEPVKITLTTQEWEKVIQHLETANKAVLRSKMPSDMAQDISLELQNAVQLLGSKIEKELPPKK